ncbi:hypothetical protein RYX36_007163, partial [Vicia faba]
MLTRCQLKMFVTLIVPLCGGEQCLLIGIRLVNTWVILLLFKGVNTVLIKRRWQ